MALNRDQVLKILRPLWMGEEAARDALLSIREGLGPEGLSDALELEELRLYLEARFRALDPFNGLLCAMQDGEKVRTFPNVRLEPKDRAGAIAAWIAADPTRAARYAERQKTEAERLESALARLRAKREAAA